MTGLRVLVIVGTDHHPFERMRQWADAWQDSHPDDEVVLQHGFTAAPVSARGVEMLAPADLTELLGTVDVAITHGGPGTISTVRAAGLVPIVVPRDPRLGEHVDDHQQRFATWAGERGLGIVVRDTAQLHEMVQQQATVGRLAPDERPGVAAIAEVGRVFDMLRNGSRGRAVVPVLRPGSRRVVRNSN